MSYWKNRIVNLKKGVSEVLVDQLKCTFYSNQNYGTEKKENKM